MYKDRKRYYKNGYIVVEFPEHHRSFDSGSGIIAVYEHILVAEDLLGRRLIEGEVVHHLDFNRSNNSPDNLLVISNPMHTKLHQWMNNYELIPNLKAQNRIALGCIRCETCEIPIAYGFTYCSPECHCVAMDTASKKPLKETLEILVLQYPMTSIGKLYGVSDNAVRKWCKKYNIPLPDMRGYWAKVAAGKITG